MSNYVNTKLNIYKAYNNGYITESEKDDLLLLLEDATIDKKKQKILDNQDILKKNINDIANDLRKMVLKYAGSYDITIKESKFFKDHEDHKERHYLLEFSLKPSDDVSKSNIPSILLAIGNKVENEFKKHKKEFLDKGLYFDNKKKDNDTRFVELHYDFY